MEGFAADLRALATKCAMYNVDDLDEAAIILWTICKAIHPTPCTLQSCIRALVDDNTLYQTLKHAHENGKYDILQQWAPIATSAFHQQPSGSHEAHLPASTDAMVAENVERFLNDIRPSIKRFVAGDITLPMWTPDRTAMHPDAANHIEALGIPSLNGTPNILLHDLGSFWEDPTLATRLKSIFIPNHHTFLLNTSGSGKTRLLLEGLCNNWGFYFTSLVDSSLLGSSDVQKSIESYLPKSPGFRKTLPPPDSPHHMPALKTNRELASRIFSRVFLARLYIFDLFVGLMRRRRERRQQQSSSSVPYKKRWLTLQLRPSLLPIDTWDIFNHLSDKLSVCSDAFVNTTTNELLVRIRKILTPPENNDNDNNTANNPQTPFFCVLDEAQYAATELSTAFRSDKTSNSSVHTTRPVLREIVRTWVQQSLGHGIFMVVAGTGISKDVVDQAMASAIMKESRYRWCSDTGAFDDPEEQRRYLLRYLPPTFASSRSGKRLIERLAYWLRGRYRFTAGYVAELLNAGFENPHTLLNSYIAAFTHFTPTDAPHFVQAERSKLLPITTRYKLDFDKLNKHPDMLATIHQLTVYYTLRSTLPFPLGRDEKMFVEYGFARFTDASTHTVAADEPLVLLAASQWTESHYRTSYTLLAKQIRTHEANGSNGFENFLALCLSRAFAGGGGRRLDEVFTFCMRAGAGSVPEWVRKEAELVALFRCSDLKEVEVGRMVMPMMVKDVGGKLSQPAGPSVTVGVDAKSVGETKKWLKHRFHAPLCYPHESMGPDLLFVLRTVEDGLMVWVALQAKSSVGKDGVLSRSLLRKAMKSVTPSKFFTNKVDDPLVEPPLVAKTLKYLDALPNRRRHGAGAHSLIRVIASFPAHTNLKRGIEEDPDNGDHPIASLNMDFLKRFTKDFSPLDFLSNLERKTLPQSRKKRKSDGTGFSRVQKRLKI